MGESKTVGAPTNYLLLVIDSVCKSIDANNAQQRADSESTIMDMNIEQKEYDDAMTQLSQDAASVNKWAAKVSANPDNQQYKDFLLQRQTWYQQHETQMQTNTQQADGGTQAEQTQTGQDSSNAQNKVQLVAAINQIISTAAAADIKI